MKYQKPKMFEPTQDDLEQVGQTLAKSLITLLTYLK